MTADDSLRTALALTSSTIMYGSHLKAWISRLILAVDDVAEVLRSDIVDSTALKLLLGITTQRGEVTRHALRTCAERVVRRVDVRSERSNSILFRNIDALGRWIALNETEKQLLAFVSLVTINPSLRRATQAVTETTVEYLAELLACVLEMPTESVSSALSRGGTLFDSRLIVIAEEDFSFERRLVAKDALAWMLLTRHETERAMLDMFFRHAPAAELRSVNFAHLGDDHQLALEYLKAAVKHGLRGVNILLYGPTGTGKTQLARSLAHEAEAVLFEVTSANDFGLPGEPIDRLSSYQLCQRALAMQGNAVVVFDEIEDIFPTERGYGASGLLSKAWVNEMLETNAIPTIWICNAVMQMDAAYLRRFDMTIWMPDPPRRVRAMAFKSAFEKVGVEDSVADRLVANPLVTPAVSRKIARIARALGTAGNEVESLAKVVLKQVQDLAPERTPIDVHVGDGLQIDFFRTEPPAEEVLRGLAIARPPISLCLHGPPGAGKTSFARLIAHQLGKELMVVRASDILAPYVGMNEANIVNAFRTAERLDAVLLIDEADSLLASRLDAHQRWEISITNEFLVQIELFEGVVICATNLIETLDEAASRRFALSIRFDFLDAKQVMRMLFARFEVESERAHVQAARRVADIRNATPGDFAALDKRRTLLGQNISLDEYVGWLAVECERKRSHESKPVGFVRQNRRQYEIA